MATRRVVTNTIVRPGGAAATTAVVSIELAGEDGERIHGYVTSEDDTVEGRTVPTVDSSGVWSASLFANLSLTPAGSMYKVTERVDGRSAIYYITVPDTVGPHYVEDILEDGPPGPLASSALAQHINDTVDAHDASAVSVAGLDFITSDDVQSALREAATYDAVTPSALPAFFSAIANYRDDLDPTLRIIGLGSSVGVGATLPTPSTQSPVAYFASRLNAVFNPLGNMTFAATNGSVNGHAFADILTDYTAAKVTAGGTPTLVLIVMGMNDGAPALYHAGQTLPGVATFLAAAIDAVRADGGEPIVCTSPHPNTDTYSFTNYPFGGTASYPGTNNLIPALTAAEGAPTVEAIGDGGATVRVSYRHLRVNALMRQTCIDRGVAVIDAEMYWLRALRSYALTSLFDTAETVHPNLLGHQVSYWAAIDDFMRSLHAGYAQASKAPLWRGAVGINTATPTAALHTRSRSVTDVPFRATRSTGVDALVANEDGSVNAGGGITSGGFVKVVGALPPTPVAGSAALASGSIANIGTPTTMFTLVDAQAGILTVQATQSGIGRQVSVFVYVASASQAYVLQLGASTGSSTGVFTIAASGMTIQITPAAANTNMKYSRVDL